MVLNIPVCLALSLWLGFLLLSVDLLSSLAWHGRYDDMFQQLLQLISNMLSSNAHAETGSMRLQEAGQSCSFLGWHVLQPLLYIYDSSLLSPTTEQVCTLL